jgi:hypothetical protein
MATPITRVYSDHVTAATVVRNLQAAGLAESHIGILASNAEGWHAPGSGSVNPIHDKDRDGSDDRVESAAAFGSVGLLAGGGAGVAAGLGMLAIPGIGPIVAMGWLASLAAGAIAGGAAGGIIGAFLESGTSEENAHLYAEALRRGGTIITARVPASDPNESHYVAIMDAGAFDVTARAAAYRDTGWHGYDPAAPAYDAEQARKERAIYPPM